MLPNPRFADLLSDDEHVLWSGQPNAKAFRPYEQRIADFSIWLIIAWSLVFSVTTIRQHGLPYSYTHGGAAITVSSLVLAGLIKVVYSLSQSQAGCYWYTITSRRIIAEVPDEGSQTTLVVNWSEVIKVSMNLNRANRDANIGTITITTKTYRKREVHFRCICDVGAVHHILEQITNL